MHARTHAHTHTHTNVNATYIQVGLDDVILHLAIPDVTVLLVQVGLEVAENDAGGGQSQAAHRDVDVVVYTAAVKDICVGADAV